MVISNKPVSCGELLDRFPQLFTDISGDRNQHFSSVASPDNATANAAVFLSTPKAMQRGLDTKAAVIVVGKKAREAAEAHFKKVDHASERTPTLLISPNPELAMAMIINAYFLKTPYTNQSFEGIHPSAVISPTADIGANVRVGPHVFIGRNVKLGTGCYIGASAVIEDEAEIGEQSVIHPLAFIGHSTVIGKACEVHPNATVGKEGFGYSHDHLGNHYRIPHQGRVVLEDDVHIGAGCTIDRATFGETRLRQGTKFDNQVHIGHNCEVGRNSLITAGCMMAGSSKVGANFIAGGNSAVTGHVEVCDNVQIGGYTAIGKSITEPGAYSGHPIMPLREATKMRASLSHLYDMRKQLRTILKHLGLNAEEATGNDG